MPLSDIIRLIFLAAIWGGSFVFMRVAVPEFGPLPAAGLRVTLAGTALWMYALAQGIPMRWRQYWKVYAIAGFFSSAFPFACFAYAAQYLPTAYSAVLNSTAPLFGAVLSVFWLSEKLSLRKLLGLLLGITGVTILVGAGALALNAPIVASAAACLMAAASYAVSAIVIKKSSQPDANGEGIPAMALACGSFVLSGIMLMPFAAFSWPVATPGWIAIACLASLALLSSALAQVMFIPLIVRIGPARAMTVTFLIPIFGMLWGFLFLHEALHLSTVAGAAIILVAMRLILFVPQAKRRTTVLE